MVKSWKILSIIFASILGQNLACIETAIIQMSEGPSIVYKKVDPVDGGFEQKKIYVSFRTLGGLLIAFKGYHKICIRPGYRFGELKVTGFEYYNKPFGYIPFGIGYVDFHSDPPRIYSANMTPEIFDENWKRMVR